MTCISELKEPKKILNKVQYSKADDHGHCKFQNEISFKLTELNNVR